MIYLINGPAQFLSDVALPRDQLLGQLFDVEYVLTILFYLVIWFVAGQFGELLRGLEEDHQRLDLERGGVAVIDRSKIRGELMGLIFGIGGVLLFVTALLKANIVQNAVRAAPSPGSFWFLLLYFVLGLGLLAQTRFSMMRIRWYLDDTTIVHPLGSKWIAYSLLTLLAIAGLVLFLPTRYSVNFLALLGYLIDFLALLISLIAFLLFTPLALIYNLLASLLGGNATTLQPPHIPQPVPPPANPGAPVAWLEVLKSVLFWSTLLAAIGFSIFYYLRQRQGLLAALRKLTLWTWLANAWSWLRGGYAGLHQQVGRVVGDSLGRMRSRLSRKEPRIDLHRPVPGNLPPREQVLLLYLGMLKHNQENGFPRRPSQTPQEYAHSLDRLLPEEYEDIHGLTDVFVEARYSRHEIDAVQASLVRQCWQNIHNALLSRREDKPQG